MADALTCSRCQKRYVWKAQYAGRLVRCQCGQRLRMPETAPGVSAAPAVAAAQGSGVIELDMASPQGAPPASSSSHRADVAPPTSSDDLLELSVTPEELAAQDQSVTTATAARAALSARPSRVEQALMDREDEMRPSVLKEKVLPGMVAVGGVIVQIVLWFVFANSARAAILGAAGMLAVELLVFAPVAVLAVFITAKLLDVGFGPLVPALVKIIAIAVGAGGVADILFFKIMLSVEFDYQILLVGFVLHMLLIGLPVAIIYELEAFEMALITAIIVIPRLVMLYAMGYAFPHWF